MKFIGSRLPSRLLVLLLCFSLLNPGITPQFSPAAGAEPISPQQTAQDAEHTIAITANGFTPATLTVSVTDEITWVNQTSTPHVLRGVGQNPESPMGDAALFLPFIQSRGTNATPPQGEGRLYLPSVLSGASQSVGRSVQDFTQRLEPGQSFTFRYELPGTYFFYLESMPQNIGRVIVTGKVQLGTIETGTVTSEGRREGSIVLPSKLRQALDVRLTDDLDAIGVVVWVENQRLWADVPAATPPGNYVAALIIELPAGEGTTEVPAEATIRVSEAPQPTTEESWVTGFVYNTLGCNTHLTICPALADVRITMARVDTAALAQARAMRQQLLRSTNYQTPLSPSTNLAVTTALDDEVYSQSDGSFAFPIPDTGVYWLRAEKDGYTYAQRQLEVVKGRSIATNALYLTPIDSTVTECGSAGCSHTNSDGSIQIEIPAGAIGDGETVDVTATNFKHVEYLPKVDSD